ncbi:MAG: selenide, water dikinase SelD [Deltaproteobacteria bacterium]|nr:selenide, water dikinase SelD [Deltaproteobacteria bacterium]
MVEVLSKLPAPGHDWVDRRLGPLEDACVFRPDGAGRSLVLTLDVITPIVDDPHAFGGIAAVNAMSDVYAMGGRPELALSFAGFPTDELGTQVLEQILAGAHEACARAGCAIVGGHTLVDTEPKCGLAVVGSVDPQHVWSQRLARPGQALVLTKPLGTGLVGQAVRAGTVEPGLLAAATAQMLQLNDTAAEVGRKRGATACTDVTGFGLLGHLRHLVEAAGLEARLCASAVPLIDGVLPLARSGCVPGGTRRNLKYASACTDFEDAIDEALRLVLADAQTSGGLLLCLPADQAEAAVAELRATGCTRAAFVGELLGGERPAIHVRA